MNPDIFAVHQRQLAKRTGQTPAEYAAAIEGYRRPTGWALPIWLAMLVAFLLAFAKWGM